MQDIEPDMSTVSTAHVAPAILIARFYDFFTEARPQSQLDFVYFDGLVADFGDKLDILEEMKQFHAWALDQHGPAIRQPRSRFRNWLIRARTYRRPLDETSDQ